MRDHSFRDVAKTPVENFEFATTSYVKPSWIGKSTHLWMCGTSKNGDQKEREGKERGRRGGAFNTYLFGYQLLVKYLKKNNKNIYVKNKRIKAIFIY